MPKRKNPGRPREFDQRIIVRLTFSDIRKLDKAAKKKGVSRSALLRQLVRDIQ